MVSRPNANRGFSLVELLLVLLVIAILSTLVFQSTATISSTSLTTGAAELRNAAEQARQTAEASGYPVELRIYQPTGSPGYYTAFQLVEINGTTQQNLNLIRLPQGVVITNASPASSMLTEAPSTNVAPSGFISANNSTCCIRFSPLGSIQGISSTATLTPTLSLVPLNAFSNTLPKNYATVSFDPVLGSTAIYRP